MSEIINNYKIFINFIDNNLNNINKNKLFNTKKI